MSVLSKVAVLAIAGTLAACNTMAPIQNVSAVPVASQANRPLARDEVRGAIVRAGAALGWVMKDDGPDRLMGTLMLRTHTAVVEIPYTPSSYAIRYRSSVNLGEGNGNIHRNFNGWISNLTRGINAQFAAS